MHHQHHPYHTSYVLLSVHTSRSVIIIIIILELWSIKIWTSAWHFHIITSSHHHIMIPSLSLSSQCWLQTGYLPRHGPTAFPLLCQLITQHLPQVCKIFTNTFEYSITLSTSIEIVWNHYSQTHCNFFINLSQVYKTFTNISKYLTIVITFMSMLWNHYSKRSCNFFLNEIFSADDNLVASPALRCTGIKKSRLDYTDIYWYTDILIYWYIPIYTDILHRY